MQVELGGAGGGSDTVSSSMETSLESGILFTLLPPYFISARKLNN